MPSSTSGMPTVARPAFYELRSTASGEVVGRHKRKADAQDEQRRLNRAARETVPSTHENVVDADTGEVLIEELPPERQTERLVVTHLGEPVSFEVVEIGGSS